MSGAAIARDSLLALGKPAAAARASAAGSDGLDAGLADADIDQAFRDALSGAADTTTAGATGAAGSPRTGAAATEKPAWAIRTASVAREMAAGATPAAASESAESPDTDAQIGQVDAKRPAGRDTARSEGHGAGTRTRRAPETSSGEPGSQRIIASDPVVPTTDADTGASAKSSGQDGAATTVPLAGNDPRIDPASALLAVLAAGTNGAAKPAPAPGDGEPTARGSRQDVAAPAAPEPACEAPPARMDVRVTAQETHFAPVNLALATGASGAELGLSRAGAAVPAVTASQAGPARSGASRSPDADRADRPVLPETAPAKGWAAPEAPGESERDSRPARSTPLSGRLAELIAEAAGREDSGGRIDAKAQGRDALSAPVESLASVAGQAISPAQMSPGTQIASRVATALASEGLGNAHATTANTVGATVSEGVLRVLEIELRPADLGTVTVRLTVKDDTLSVAVDARQQATATLLNADRDRIRDALAATGYEIEALTVRSSVTSSDASADAGGQSGMGDGGRDRFAGGSRGDGQAGGNARRDDGGSASDAEGHPGRRQGGGDAPAYRSGLVL